MISKNSKNSCTINIDVLVRIASPTKSKGFQREQWFEMVWMGLKIFLSKWGKTHQVPPSYDIRPWTSGGSGVWMQRIATWKIVYGRCSRAILGPVCLFFRDLGVPKFDQIPPLATLWLNTLIENQILVLAQRGDSHGVWKDCWFQSGNPDGSPSFFLWDWAVPHHRNAGLLGLHPQWRLQACLAA